MHTTLQTRMRHHLANRRHNRIAALAITFVIAGCSAGAASTGSTTAESAPESTTIQTTADATAAVAGLYDTSIVHDIEVTFDADDYANLLATYKDTGEKVWIEATVVIDGNTYRQVGLRLKGNSSLAGLGGGLSGGLGGNGPANQEFPPAAGGDQCTIDITATGSAETVPSDADTTEAVDTPDADTEAVGPDVGAESESPETLPWLIRLDKYIDDQEHAGVAEFVVRSNSSETALNEAVALGLLSAAGLATQEATAVRFTVNDSEPVLRLVIESPNDEWVAEQFDEENIEAIGQLYKAESTGDWQYHGDDATAYEEIWDQEAGEDDLTPLTEFLAFLNDSSDEEFAAGLADRLDVEAFARYLAIEDLMDNFDDIAGPGNNSYLYFDPDTGIATVVAWDHNLAFGGMGQGGPNIGGPGGNVPGQMPTFDPANLPEGCELPDFQPGALPEGGIPVGGDGGPNMMGSNILVERFNSVPEFAALYDAAIEDLTTELFVDGTAEELLTKWTDLLTAGASDVVSADTIEAEAQLVRKAFPSE